MKGIISAKLRLSSRRKKVNPLIYWQPQQEPGFMIHMDTGIAIVMDLIQQMAGNLLMDTGIILDRRGIVLPDGSG